MKNFLLSALGRTVLGMVFLDAIVSVAVAWTGRIEWLPGIWVAAGWFTVNSLLMWRMAEWVRSERKPDQKRILLWSVVKFPVLYLAGLGLLLIPAVRVQGVLVTFTAFLIGMALSPFVNIGKRAH